MKPKPETFFHITDQGVVTKYDDDILKAVNHLKKTPKGAVIRSDGVMMAGETRAALTAEERGPVPWGRVRKMRYDEDEEAPKTPRGTKKRISSSPSPN